MLQSNRLDFTQSIANSFEVGGTTASVIASFEIDGDGFQNRHMEVINDHLSVAGLECFIIGGVFSGFDEKI